MYCKFCGSEIDPNARFCPSCGMDQTSSESRGYEPSSGGQGYGGGRYSQSSLGERKQALYMTMGVTLVATFILGVVVGIIVLLLMMLYYGMARKSSSDVMSGCIFGGIGGIVIGFLLNFILLVTILGITL